MELRREREKQAKRKKIDAFFLNRRLFYGSPVPNDLKPILYAEHFKPSKIEVIRLPDSDSPFEKSRKEKIKYRLRSISLGTGIYLDLEYDNYAEFRKSLIASIRVTEVRKSEFYYKYLYVDFLVDGEARSYFFERGDSSEVGNTISTEYKFEHGYEPYGVDVPYHQDEHWMLLMYLKSKNRIFRVTEGPDDKPDSFHRTEGVLRKVDAQNIKRILSIIEANK